MTHATAQHARDNWPCPQSRAFAKPQDKCRGAECPAWRWATGQVFTDIVKSVAEQIGETSGPKAKAAAIVAADPEKYGCHGYCGLGGGI